MLDVFSYTVFLCNFNTLIANCYDLKPVKLRMETEGRCHGISKRRTQLGFQEWFNQRVLQISEYEQQGFLGHVKKLIWNNMNTQSTDLLEIINVLLVKF